MWPFKNKKDMEEQRLEHLTDRVVEQANLIVQNKAIDELEVKIKEWRQTAVHKAEEELFLKIKNEVSQKVYGEEFIDMIVARINRKQLT